MDGIHDLGGMDGFGPVERDDDEPLFHAEWEAKVFALAGLLATNGLIPSGDAFRHGIERIDPVAYLTHGYYGRWLAGIEGVLGDVELVSSEDRRWAVEAIDPAVRLVPIQGLNPPWAGARSSNEARESGDRRALATAPRFKTGQTVQTRGYASPGHTRLPRYARGKTGVIHKLNGGWVFPDSNAHGQGEDPQHLYTVAFSGAELWGADGDQNLAVYLDLFEPYLQEV